jgi:hypothetical protein
MDNTILGMDPIWLGYVLAAIVLAAWNSRKR